MNEWLHFALGYTYTFFFFLYQVLVFLPVFLYLFPLGVLIDHGTTQFGAVIAVS